MQARMRKIGGCGWYCVNADKLFCVDFKHLLRGFFPKLMEMSRLHTQAGQGSAGLEMSLGCTGVTG